MQENDETYLVSFGSIYRRHPHPVLGFWPELGDDAVLEVKAKNDLGARARVYELIGSAWCAIYGPTQTLGWDAKNLGSLEDAVAEPRDTSWCVGVSITLNADGTFELNLEDAVGLLSDENAPPALVAALDEKLTYETPMVTWVRRH